jgi:hypothetical protein
MGFQYDPSLLDFRLSDEMAAVLFARLWHGRTNRGGQAVDGLLSETCQACEDGILNILPHRDQESRRGKPSLPSS